MLKPPGHRKILSLLLLTLPAAAHHSPARFDLSQDQFLEGTVRDFSFANPHVYFEIEVAGPGGAPRTYRVEAGGAANMVALGFDGDSVSVGEQVVIHVKPNRDPDGRTVLGWLLAKADGTQIPLHVRAMSQTEPGDSEASGLAGTWVPQAVGFAELAVAARAWPVNESGRRTIEATRAARDASRSSCVPFGPPALMVLPSAVMVEASDTSVIFRLDVMGAERTVHLDRQHPADPEPSLFGHSVGRWEGDTLVVETIGFRPHPDGYAFDLPSSASKRLVERFTLASDRKHIDYEAVVDDPEIFAEPVIHRSRWDYRPAQQPSNVPCDNESAGRFTEDN